MKYILIVSVLLLAACRENGSDETSDMITICLDRVAYWVDGVGNTQMMAPRIDPVNLEFVRCEVGTE